MIDRLFSATLAFCLLAGGTAAIGSALFEGQGTARRAVQVVELPRVEVIVQRIRPDAARQVAAATANPAALRRQ